jgi:hypothetical protein
VLIFTSSCTIAGDESAKAERTYLARLAKTCHQYPVTSSIMATDKAIQKETGDATVVEDVPKSTEAVDVLDIDARILQAASEAPPFYKNHNLLILYLLIIPGCLVPAVTLGFDSAMMNVSLLSFVRSSCLGAILTAISGSPSFAVMGQLLVSGDLSREKLN